jgi:hypothetical protein
MIESTRSSISSLKQSRSRSKHNAHRNDVWMWEGGDVFIMLGQDMLPSGQLFQRRPNVVTDRSRARRRRVRSTVQRPRTPPQSLEDRPSGHAHHIPKPHRSSDHAHLHLHHHHLSGSTPRFGLMARSLGSHLATTQHPRSWQQPWVHAMGRSFHRRSLAHPRDVSLGEAAPGGRRQPFFPWNRSHQGSHQRRSPTSFTIRGRSRFPLPAKVRTVCWTKANQRSVPSACRSYILLPSGWLAC